MNAPTGLTMMLKAMGIEFDPKMFKTMTDAVVEIRDRLRRIEEKVNKLSGENSVPSLPEHSTEEKPNSHATNRS